MVFFRSLEVPVGDMVNHKNALYYLSKEKTTWAEAEKECVHLGGHLVSIHNKEEENVLRKEMTARYRMHLL